MGSIDFVYIFKALIYIVRLLWDSPEYQSALHFCRLCGIFSDSHARPIF